METQIVNQQPEPIKTTKPITQDIGHDKLLSTLYFLFDAFARCQIDFFLVRQTAKDAMSSHQLTGDHLDIGVRYNQWLSDSKDILFDFFNNEHVVKTVENEDSITLEYKDVPFTIHIYPDNECILNLVPIAYEYESFNIPNQFERFEREFDNKGGDILEK